jgi:hypothetical protein
LLRAALVLAAVLALFYSPALLGGGQFMYRDNGRLHLPMKRYIAGELARGHLPEWNPWFGLGAPIVAMGVDAVQHPFNLLLVVLPFHLGFKLWVLLSYLLAGTGAWLLARRLGAGWHAALAAGFAYAFSGFLVSSSDNVTYLTTLAAVPLVLAAFHGWLDTGGPGRLLAFGLASALCAAGGDPMGWGFSMAALPIYGAVFAGRLRGLGRGLLAAAAGAVAASPFLLPVVAWIPGSSRGEPLDWVEHERYKLSFIRLLELFVPHVLRPSPGALSSPVFAVYDANPYTSSPWVLSVYLGASAVALASLGATTSRRARLLLGGAAVAVWMSLGTNAGFGQVASRLPLLSSFRYWEKMAVWAVLLVAMASTFGFERLLADRRAARRFAWAVGAVAAVAIAARIFGLAFPEGLARLLQRGTEVVAARMLAGNLMDGLEATGLVCAALGLVALALSRETAPRHAPALLVAVVLLDVVAANVRGYVLASPAITEVRSRLVDTLQAQPGLQRVITPFEMTDKRWPELRQFESTFRWGAYSLDPAWNVAFGVGNFRTYAGMPPAREQRFNRRAGAKRLPNVGLWGVGYAVVPGDPASAAAVNLSAPHAVVAADLALPVFLVGVPHRPRAYLARAVASVDRRQAMEFALDEASTLSERSVVEGPVPADYAPPRGEARVVSDAAERIAVETASDGPALLVLNDVFAPGWTAAVDGGRAEIWPANYLARGVWVEAGAHRVEFAYRTPLLREGWIAFLAGAIALGAWALLRAASRREREG